MDIESIFRKPGRDWTPEEIQAVFDWLQREMLDKLVRFAYGFTQRKLDQERALELAKDMVADKLKDAHHSRHTYDPTHYRGTKCPFRNWIYCLVARAATRRADQETRRQARNRQAQEKEREQQILSSPSQLKPNIDWKEVQP